jgi:hypothetical protein
LALEAPLAAACGRNFATVVQTHAATVWKNLDERAREPQEIDALYTRIAEDLRAGRPLLIVSYVGLISEFNDQPERNASWGSYYGNATYFKRSHRDKHTPKLFTHPRWTQRYETEADQDPVRSLVFHHRSSPNEAWKAYGVQDDFDIYLVLLAYRESERAGLELAANLRLDDAPVLSLDDGTALDLSQAQAMGYEGHNYFYDWGFDWDGFETAPGRVLRPKGLFSISCRTAREPGWFELVRHNVSVLLFAADFVSAEGYTMLAVVDGLATHASSAEVAGLANDAYAYYHSLNHPEWKRHNPWVSQNSRLHPPPRKSKR